MLRSLSRATLVVALVAAAAPAAAQTRSFTLCDAGNQFCAGVDLALVTPTTLQVDLRNLGVAGNLNSFISGFGLFNLGGVGGTLTGATFNGVSPLADLLAANSGGNNDPFAENGAGNDLQSGAGTQALAIGSDFSNDGFRPCTFGDATSGGSVRYETCAGEYGRFVFGLNGALSAQQFQQLGFAVRAQALGANGQGSDKCFSAGDADCIFTGTPSSTVPEPSTYALMGSGLLGIAGVASRRRRQQQQG